MRLGWWYSGDRENGKNPTIKRFKRGFREFEDEGEPLVLQGFPF